MQGYLGYNCEIKNIFLETTVFLGTAFCENMKNLHTKLNKHYLRHYWYSKWLGMALIYNVSKLLILF